MINQSSEEIVQLSATLEKMGVPEEPHAISRKRKRQHASSLRHKRRVKRIKLENSFFLNQCKKMRRFYLAHGPNIDTGRDIRPYFKDSDILGAGYLYRGRGTEPPLSMGYVDFARQTIVQEKPQS